MTEDEMYEAVINNAVLSEKSFLRLDAPGLSDAAVVLAEPAVDRR